MWGATGGFREGGSAILGMPRHTVKVRAACGVVIRTAGTAGVAGTGSPGVCCPHAARHPRFPANPLTRREPRPSPKSLEAMRAFVAAAITDSSPGVVARQVGMSGGALAKFLEGGTPTPPMYRKLHRWYARRVEAALKAPPPAREPAPPPDPVEEEAWTAPRIVFRYSPDEGE